MSLAHSEGWSHQRERQAWAPIVASGGCICPRCGLPIHPGTRWDLGHPDDRAGSKQPEHATCNRSAGATKGNRRRGYKPRPPRPRVW